MIQIFINILTKGTDTSLFFFYENYTADFQGYIFRICKNLLNQRRCTISSLKLITLRMLLTLTVVLQSYECSRAAVSHFVLEIRTNVGCLSALADNIILMNIYSRQFLTNIKFNSNAPTIRGEVSIISSRHPCVIKQTMLSNGETPEPGYFPREMGHQSKIQWLPR